ncbi:TrkA family potassium uptake protein [Candidatus Dependentiae bacterium]|nr:TrkA family potassium uptake protein [Candidatus Dependentiae bacterium]
MKFCVIGVGRFGYNVATTLADNGMDVLAVDGNESIIASIRDKVTQAICLRVIDEEGLRTIGADEMDTVIVAMGENFAQSILITAILKQKLKTRMVIVRSISGIHRDILQLIGADQVILPEQQVGRQLADNLSLPFKALMRLSSNFCISELLTPERFIGQTLGELELYNTYTVRCLALRVNNEVIISDDSYRLMDTDILIIAGNNKDIARISKL